MSRKNYDDDDGRVIADMSELSQRTPLGFRSMEAPRNDDAASAGSESIGRDARKGYIRGALTASLLIGAAYAVGFAIVIALMVWRFSALL